MNMPLFRVKKIGISKIIRAAFCDARAKHYDQRINAQLQVWIKDPNGAKIELFEHT